MSFSPGRFAPGFTLAPFGSYTPALPFANIALRTAAGRLACAHIARIFFYRARNTTFRSLHARLEAANPEKGRGTVVGQGARKALVPRLGLAAPVPQNGRWGHNVAAGHWGG